MTEDLEAVNNLYNISVLLTFIHLIHHFISLYITVSVTVRGATVLEKHT